MLRSPNLTVSSDMNPSYSISAQMMDEKLPFAWYVLEREELYFCLRYNPEGSSQLTDVHLEDGTKRGNCDKMSIAAMKCWGGVPMEMFAV